MFPRTAAVLVFAIFTLAEPTRASDVVDFAASFIGTPYVWGAEGPNAFDCSGLTQYVFDRFDVELPRRAISQSKVGDPAGRGLRRGDLVFFSSDTRRSLVTHVGIYEGGGRMIEASKRSGRVRRSSLSEDYWVERFMFARRVMDGGIARVPQRIPDNRGRTSPTRGEVRRAAIRALEELAGALLRRPR